MIGNYIKELRKYLKMGQVEFAKSIGLTHASISRIEKGVITPRVSTIKTICAVYNVNFTWLETGQGEMFLPDRHEVRDETAEYHVRERGPEIQRYFNMLATILKKGSDVMKNAIMTNLVAFHQAVEAELKDKDLDGMIEKIQADIESRYKNKIAEQDRRLETMQKDFEAMKAYIRSLGDDSNLRRPATGGGAATGKTGVKK